MSEQVEIELGELSSPDQQDQEPFEETRFDPDDLERYGNFLSDLLTSNNFNERFRDYSA